MYDRYVNIKDILDDNQSLNENITTETVLKANNTDVGRTITSKTVTGAITDWINVVSLGADNTGVNDCSGIINSAITNCSDSDTIYLPNGTYRISSSILIEKSINFICEGELKYTGINFAIIVKSSINNVFIKHIVASNGGGVELLATTAMIYNNKIVIDTIEASTHGILLQTNGNGIQYNKFEFKFINVSGNAIYLNAPNNWIGENHFVGGMVKGVNGVKIEADSSAEISGSRFLHIGFEGLTNAIYLKNTHYNSFTDCRAEESISGKYLILEGANYGNRIGLDAILISGIDLTNSTTGTNYIMSYVMNNATQYTPVTNELKINGKVIEYCPISRVLKNLFTDTNATATLTFTANIDANADYNLYTDFMLIANMTFTIGKSYYSNRFQDLLLSVQSGTTINDVDGNVILASSTTTYNYSVVRVRRLTTNFGTQKWQIEKVCSL